MRVTGSRSRFAFSHSCPPLRGSMSIISMPLTTPVATPVKGPGYRVQSFSMLAASETASLKLFGVQGFLFQAQGKIVKGRPSNKSGRTRSLPISKQIKRNCHRPQRAALAIPAQRPPNRLCIRAVLKRKRQNDRAVPH